MANFLTTQQKRAIAAEVLASIIVGEIDASEAPGYAQYLAAVESGREKLFRPCQRVFIVEEPDPTAQPMVIGGEND